ncbi:hypothetical protein IC617_05000 [Neiella sp. HB171785]|uniref:Uncharacterized protein n=1 Tax=Neiella litorisoli TaxID=2771431 RepID=A0A8J6QTG3_9GAMM|nr:hypothetical protein [Neiella litorisoli]MBD1388777.1 hypothetical protein [Neiella litorisoli]
MNLFAVLSIVLLHHKENHMEQSDLIFYYHFLVMAIIAATAIVALGGILQIGIFKAVSDSYKKILVGALLVELTAAFIGVYQTLPKLEFKKAEKYAMEIKYSDLITGYVDRIQGYQRSCFDSFHEPNRLASFFRCEGYVNTYTVLSDLTQQNGFQDAVTVWLDTLNDEKRSCISSYDSIQAVFSECKSVLGRYHRNKSASNGIGKGELYVSVDKNHYEGVASYYFPKETRPVILQISGRMIDDQHISFRFDQSASAIEFNSRYIPRDPASFEVCLKQNESGLYEGKMIIGEGFQCGESNIDEYKSIATVSVREIL